MHVRDSIKENFKDLTVLETSKYKGAVARGAVLSKIYDNFISREEFKRTKASVTLLEVTPALRKLKFFKRLHLKKGDCDGKNYFWAATYLVKQGDKSKDGQEISSEDNAKDARIRYIDDGDFQFSEKILTFNYRPGKDTWAAYTKGGTWISQEGKSMPQPEQQDLITWSPLADDNEIGPDDLDTGMADGKTYKILRYSVLLQANSIGTKYWAKCWASEAMKRKTGGKTVWSLSQPVDRKALFETQAISQSLADSFGLEETYPDTNGTKSASQIVHTSGNPGLESDSAEPSQTNRLQLGNYQSPPDSSGRNSHGNSLVSPSRAPPKGPKNAVQLGAEEASNTRTIGTPRQPPGTSDQAAPQSMSSRRGLVQEGSLRDNGSELEADKL